MPKLILSQPASEVPQLLELRPGLNRLGRNPTNDFRLADASISSFHCELDVLPDGVVVRDLNSTNGTFIDGKLVQESRLNAGQTLQLGSVAWTFSAEEAEVPRVAIPEISGPESRQPVVLPDGSLACGNHPESAAIFQCRQCHGAFCGNCVRVLSRSGGATHYFCTVCPGQCEPIAQSSEASGKRSTFLGRLTQTLKLTFKR